MTSRVSWITVAAVLLLPPAHSRAGEPLHPSASPAITASAAKLPTMHTSLPKTIDYVELPTRNITATKAFFAALFGWSFEDYGPDYVSFDDGRTVGGFYTSDKVAALSDGSPLIVFYQSDLAACQETITSLGGRVSRDTFAFPGGHRFHFTEPGGGEFAVWSDK